MSDKFTNCLIIEAIEIDRRADERRAIDESDRRFIRSEGIFLLRSFFAKFHFRSRASNRDRLAHLPS